MPRTVLVAGALLVSGLFSLAAEISSCSGSTVGVSTVNRFIAAVRAVRDAVERSRDDGVVRQLAETIYFPLERAYPLPSIHSVDEFMIRYAEVFDEDFMRMIVESDKSDCWNRGWRGIYFLGGLVRLGDDAVTEIHYESDAEEHERLRMVEVERDHLHGSLQEYDYPVLEWETCTYRIRVDRIGRIGDASYRYASWESGRSHASQPDIVINGGELRVASGDVGQRKISYVFQNDEYEYSVWHDEWFGRRVPWSDWVDDDEWGWLHVYRADEMLLAERVVVRSGEHQPYRRIAECSD